MTDEEVERKIHIAGALGCAIGFICGAGLMAAVGIIFWGRVGGRWSECWHIW